MLGLVGADVASQMTEWLSTQNTKAVLAVPASAEMPLPGSWQTLGDILHLISSCFSHHN